MNPLHQIKAACFDWGGTLMSERGGPDDLPMGLWPRVEAIEGAAEALAALKGRVPLAIATNATVSGRAMIELALRRVGFDEYFQNIFCYIELGCRKDQPEFWSAVAHGLGVPLAGIAMIGDSYEQDAHYPRSFGVQGVWFDPSGSAARKQVATPVVAHLPTFAAWVTSAAG
ncbi:HAD family hydrolase [Chitiniphilus shinanonensis]|uniref:HAD family hydrolase n=1 Tax=Chitiniphilus shinanonensis TaxID=553088 RepID=UPI00303AC50F